MAKKQTKEQKQISRASTPLRANGSCSSCVKASCYSASMNSLYSRSFCEPNMQWQHRILYLVITTPEIMIELSWPSQPSEKSAATYGSCRKGNSWGFQFPRAPGHILQPPAVTEASDVQNKEVVGTKPSGPILPEKVLQST